MNIHVLGIGGAGLSGLAGWLIDKGHSVTGCDAVFNSRISPLINKGVSFNEGNSPDHITEKLDWLIIPNIDQNHDEIIAAKKKGIKISTYFQALGEITKDYFTIAIAGAHGKTTTTLMTKTILEKADKDPNAIVGEGIYRFGKSNLFVVEACEYKKQFLSLFPDILLITNIAHDHPDFYQDLDDVVSAFKELVDQVKPGGTVVGFFDDANVNQVLQYAGQRGLKTATYGNQLTSFNPSGWGSKSSVLFDQEASLSLAIPGKHNVFNALGAMVIAQTQKIKITTSIDYLADFSGCCRRMQKLGQLGQAVIIDDYGHHPDQIRAVLKSVRQVFPQDRIAAVFEPHQYERTWQLMEEFSKSFSSVDKLYLLPIYKVKGRESEQALAGASQEKLVVKLSEQKVNVEPVISYDDLWSAVEKESKKSAAIVFLSAGPLSDALEDRLF